MLRTWKEQFQENLETCRPDLLAEMEKAGTLEAYLQDRENQAIEMYRQLRKSGHEEHQAVELVANDLLLREKEEPEEPLL